MRYLPVFLLITVLLFISCKKDEIAINVNQIGIWNGIKLIEEYSNDTLMFEYSSDFNIELFENETAVITTGSMTEEIDWHIFNESISILIIRELVDVNGDPFFNFKNMDICNYSG